MYCVHCGKPLQGGNQAGLVCQPCKQVQERKRRSERRPMVIRYCFRCGKPYHPQDASIQHPCCSAEQAKQSLASDLRRHDLKQQGGYAQ